MKIILLSTSAAVILLAAAASYFLPKPFEPDQKPYQLASAR